MDYGLLLELHVLTQAACSYALLIGLTRLPLVYQAREGLADVIQRGSSRSREGLADVTGIHELLVNQILLFNFETVATP